MSAAMVQQYATFFRPDLLAAPTSPGHERVAQLTEPDWFQDFAMGVLVDLLGGRVAVKQRQLGQRVLLVADVKTFGIGMRPEYLG